jgi:exosortase
MTPAIPASAESGRTPAPFSWGTVTWISALLAICYGPVLYALAAQWYSDADMGHGFFVPAFCAYVAWKNRAKIAGRTPRPSWWGLAIMVWAAFQLYIGTLGAELFLARTSFVISLIGAVLFLGGAEYLGAFAFPLFVLFFMVPIPAIIYNQITFPLQLLASQVAEASIGALGIPIIREGNVLELAQQKLNVVEACSGIRSLLTLTFFSLVYGYFCEKRFWVRVVLFFATIPIAILANAGRVTLTGIVSQFKPELAEGLFHEAEGFVIFAVALAILIATHQAIVRASSLIESRTARGRQLAR